MVKCITKHVMQIYLQSADWDLATPAWFAQFERNSIRVISTFYALLRVISVDLTSSIGMIYYLFFKVDLVQTRFLIMNALSNTRFENGLYPLDFMVIRVSFQSVTVSREIRFCSSPHETSYTIPWVCWRRDNLSFH
jgi:hypothetical protein